MHLKTLHINKNGILRDVLKTHRKARKREETKQGEQTENTKNGSSQRPIYMSVNKPWFIHIMDYQSIIEVSELVKYTTAWMTLQEIMLKEKRLSKHHIHMIPLTTLKLMNRRVSGKQRWCGVNAAMKVAWMMSLWRWNKSVS